MDNRDEELEKNAEKQREYFNKLAPVWREANPLGDGEIAALLKDIPFKAGERVLDVACGAGVLDARLLSMGLIVDGVDISEKMIERARANPSNRGVNYTVADFYRLPDGCVYDCLLVFDSYPHFPDKKRFCEKAYALLKDGGMLWIFFDSGRAAVNGRHAAKACGVSVELMGAEKEAEAFLNGFKVTELSDDGKNYRIGLKKILRDK